MPIEQLHNLFLKTTGVCTDTRKLQKDELFVALKGPNFNGNEYAAKAIEAGAKYAMIDEEKYLLDKQHYILVPNCLTALQNLANYHRKQFNIPVIGLTGSNGKTTTKEIIATVLQSKFNVLFTKGNLNNHIGLPLTLLGITAATEIAVIEMGANHIGEIAELCKIAEPNFGLITTIGKAHLEGFGSEEGIRKTKMELFDFLRENQGFAFINADQQKILDAAERFDFDKRTTYGQSPFVDVLGLPQTEKETATLFWNKQTIKSQLYGQYNFINLMAAIAVAKHFEVNDEDIVAAIENYLPSNKRSQIINSSFNKIILDAYNANPTSMQAAIDHFANTETDNRVVILGDMLELGDEAISEHQQIISQIENSNIEQAIFIGEIFKTIENSSHQFFESTNDLLTHIKEHPLKNKNILIKGSRGIALEKVVEYL